MGLSGVFEKTKEVHATVAEKQKSSNDSIIVFNCEDKRISFVTPFWNYDAVKVG